LDLQGLSRDPSLSCYEIFPFDPALPQKMKNSSHAKHERIRIRLKTLTSQLKCIYDIAKMKGGFYYGENMSKKESSEFGALKACAAFDAELFQAQFEDWYDMIQRQNSLSINAHASSTGDSEKNKIPSALNQLSEEIRNAEIELSIAMAPKQALITIRQRLEQIENDRLKRFHVLQEIVQDVCLRELDISLALDVPEKDFVLQLPEIASTTGLFGDLLQSFGETLPL